MNDVADEEKERWLLAIAAHNQSPNGMTDPATLFVWMKYKIPLFSVWFIFGAILVIILALQFDSVGSSKSIPKQSFLLRV